MNSATERGEFIRVSEPETGIWVLRLNRPEVMNAWHGPMRAELAQVMNEIATSDARVVIFRGDEKSFSAGEDVRGMAGLTQGGTKNFRAIARQIHAAFDLVESVEVPVIAAIEGVAAGGAWSWRSVVISEYLDEKLAWDCPNQTSDLFQDLGVALG